MAAVDTNVLVPLLLDDDEEQGRAARALQRSHAPLFVPHVVLAEMAWVLVSVYGFSRDKLHALIEMLVDTEGLVVQDPGVVRVALAAFGSSRADFSHCLILAVSQHAGMSPLATFDEKLGSLPGTRRLGRKRARR